VGETCGAARFDFATRRGPELVDGAPDAASDGAAQRDAAAVPVEPQMWDTVPAPHHETAHELGMVEQPVARVDLDVIDETLGAVFVCVGAARAAPRAVERVAPAHR